MHSVRCRQARYDLVILQVVKTAISMTDDTYARVTRSAEQLGLSRSELLSRAAVAYLDQLESSSLTARIDAALEQIGADEELQEVVDAGKRRLRDLDDEW